MTLTMLCSCGQPLLVEEKWVGQQVECPVCQARQQVPIPPPASAFRAARAAASDLAPLPRRSGAWPFLVAGVAFAVCLGLLFALEQALRLEEHEVPPGEQEWVIEQEPGWRVVAELDPGVPAAGKKTTLLVRIEPMDGDLAFDGQVFFRIAGGPWVAFRRWRVDEEAIASCAVQVELPAGEQAIDLKIVGGGLPQPEELTGWRVAVKPAD